MKVCLKKFLIENNVDIYEFIDNCNNPNWTDPEGNSTSYRDLLYMQKNGSNI